VKWAILEFVVDCAIFWWATFFDVGGIGVECVYDNGIGVE